MGDGSTDEIVDPVEVVLGRHMRTPISDMDMQLCICGWQIDGGPGLHRRHVAAYIYAALGLDGPQPWVLGPKSKMGPAMRDAGTA